MLKRALLPGSAPHGGDRVAKSVTSRRRCWPFFKVALEIGDDLITFLPHIHRYARIRQLDRNHALPTWATSEADIADVRDAATGASLRRHDEAAAATDAVTVGAGVFVALRIFNVNTVLPCIWHLIGHQPRQIQRARVRSTLRTLIDQQHQH